LNELTYYINLVKNEGPRKHKRSRNRGVKVGIFFDQTSGSGSLGKTLKKCERSHVLGRFSLKRLQVRWREMGYIFKSSLPKLGIS